MADFIKFLGTAGARFVVLKQLRASGGVWLSLAGKNVLLDPGPGALLRCLGSRPKLDPAKLDAVILSHKHLDHSSDVNVIIEAMTEGGFRRRGVLFAPRDALNPGEDPVVLAYLRDYLEEIVPLEEGKSYALGELRFSTPVKHIHPVETYGLLFELPSGLRLGIITDTRFFPELAGAYPADVLVLNVVRLAPDEREIDHLNVEDARKLIAEIEPKLAVLTHFGMTMLRAKPWEVAARLEEELGIRTIAASDGLKLELDPDRLGV